jgi:hypothetical protein
MVKVLYNGVDVFSSNGAPTPFVSIADKMINLGDRWGTAKTISLRGMITGSVCTPGVAYLDLLNKQNGIVSGFRQDFKPLVIYDTATNKNNFSGDYIRVENIDFESSEYFNRLPFKIDLTYYPVEVFTGVYGVVSPVSSIKYSEQPDRSVNITRTFSAKGFNTSSSSNNALDNAINYVRSLTGNSNIIAPVLGGNNLSNFISTIQPRKKNESINRSEAIYSLTLDYSVREGAQTSSLLNYTTDIQYDEQKGIYTVDLKGDLSAGIDKTMSQLQSEFKTLDTYSLANFIFIKSINPSAGIALNPTAESININEVEEKNSIDFSFTYSTDPKPVKLNYNLNINEEYLNDKISVNFDATLTAKGPQGLRLAQLEQSLNNLNVFAYCASGYKYAIQNPSLPLNPNPKKYEIKRNLTNSNNSYNISATYDNSQIPPVDNTANFKAFSYNINVVPSLYAYFPIQFLNGDNAAFNMKYYKRGKVTINGTALVSGSADYSSNVRAAALNFLGKYESSIACSNITRIEDNVERTTLSDENGYVYSFNISDTCETPIFKL